MVGDMIYDIREKAGDKIISPTDPAKHRNFPEAHHHKDLLVRVMKDGTRCSAPRPLRDIRAQHLEAHAQADASIERLMHPHEYPVGLAEGLYKRRLAMVRNVQKTNKSADLGV